MSKITKNKDLVFTCLVGLIIAIIYLFSHGEEPVLGKLDVTLFYIINRNLSNGFLDQIASIFSEIGTKDEYLWLSLSAAIFLIGIKSGQKNLILLPFILMLAILLSSATVYSLRLVFEVSRPYYYLNSTHVFCGGKWHEFEQPLSGGVKNSFPSGHSARVSSVLGVFWPNRRFRVVIFLFVVFVLFLLTYIGSHYVSDTIVGTLIGLNIGYLVNKRIGRFLIQRIGSLQAYK